MKGNLAILEGMKGNLAILGGKFWLGSPEKEHFFLPCCRPQLPTPLKSNGTSLNERANSSDCNLKL